MEVNDELFYRVKTEKEDCHVRKLMSTLLGSKAALLALTVTPAVLNSLSDGTDFATTLRYFWESSFWNIFWEQLNSLAVQSCFFLILYTNHPGNDLWQRNNYNYCLLHSWICCMFERVLGMHIMDVRLENVCFTEAKRAILINLDKSHSVGTPALQLLMV